MYGYNPDVFEIDAIRAKRFWAVSVDNGEGWRYFYHRKSAVAFAKTLGKVNVWHRELKYGYQFVWRRKGI